MQQDEKGFINSAAEEKEKYVAMIKYGLVRELKLNNADSIGSWVLYINPPALYENTETKPNARKRLMKFFYKFILDFACRLYPIGLTETQQHLYNLIVRSMYQLLLVDKEKYDFINSNMDTNDILLFND